MVMGNVRTAEPSMVEVCVQKKNGGQSNFCGVWKVSVVTNGPFRSAVRVGLFVFSHVFPFNFPLAGITYDMEDL